jgi:hypothetical protein
MRKAESAAHSARNPRLPDYGITAVPRVAFALNTGGRLNCR